MVERRPVRRLLLLLLMVAVVMTSILFGTSEARRSPKHQLPSSALGYKSHKSRPLVSSPDDKQNIIVADDDDDDDVSDLYQISLENSRKASVDGRTSSSPKTWSGQSSGSSPYDQRKLLGLVISLSERVAALQHTLGNIKLQNHYIYRTIKKGYKSCKDSANESTIKVAAQKIEKPKCPLGYVVNPDTNMCYKLAAERITWRMARERCRMEDADLVTIETKMEQRWINQLARQSPDTRHCDFWTGATDKYAEGDWRWVANNNALSYSNWNHNEPNNGRGDEHCMQMLWVFNWAWNDARCNYNNACYICEMPLTRY